MKTAIIAAGALAAATLAAAPEASAKGMNLGFTIGGPEGYISISAPGKNYGSTHKVKNNKNYNHGNGYGPGYGNGPGYGPGYGNGNGSGYGHGQRHKGNFNLKRARANGYCLYPNEIRRRLRHQGWHGFKVKKVKPRIAIVKSRYHGTPYRLKVDRCSGQILKAKALGGYNGYSGYSGYGGHGGHGSYRGYRTY